MVAICPAVRASARHQLAHQVRDAPEQEQDAGTAHKRTHVVHHLGHRRGIRGKLREQVGHQHEERRAGRMAHFQLVAGGDKLGTVPETRRRLYSHAIDRSRHGEHNPTRQVVYSLIISHCLAFRCESCLPPFPSARPPGEHSICGAKISISHQAAAFLFFF